MRKWTIEGPDGALDVSPAVMLRCDTIQFFWGPAGQVVPSHVERCIDGPCVPLRYVDDGLRVGWWPDPSPTLDPTVEAVRDFVDRLPVEILLNICREDAALRAADARSEAARDPMDLDVLDELRRCLAYEAALAIDNPVVRRAAVDLADSWLLPSELLTVAAEGVVRPRPR